MAKFVWALDGKKYNLNDATVLYVQDKSVYGTFTRDGRSNMVRLFMGESELDAHRYIDDITSSDFDKVGEPLVKMILEYMKSYLMTNKGEYHA